MNLSNYLISANHKYYDHHQSFIDNGVIDWKTNGEEYQIGDIVYVYSTKPIGAISFKCLVNKTGITYDDRVNDDEYWVFRSFNEKNDMFFRLELLNSFKDDRLSYYNLRKCGLKGNLNSRIELSPKVLDYINKIEEDALLNEEFLVSYKRSNDKHTLKNKIYDNVTFETAKYQFEIDRNYYGTALTLRKLIEQKCDMKSLGGREMINVIFKHFKNDIKGKAYRYWRDINSIIHDNESVEADDILKLEAAIIFFEKYFKLL